jgi:hypothetical protein
MARHLDAVVRGQNRLQRLGEQTVVVGDQNSDVVRDVDGGLEDLPEMCPVTVGL